jgi:hypothetical protein
MGSILTVLACMLLIWAGSAFTITGIRLQEKRLFIISTATTSLAIALTMPFINAYLGGFGPHTEVLIIAQGVFFLIGSLCMLFFQKVSQEGQLLRSYGLTIADILLLKRTHIK